MESVAASKKQVLTDSEAKLLEELRKCRFGEVTIEMKAGQPHRILKGIESIML